jgi:hypothetical protein
MAWGSIFPSLELQGELNLINIALKGGTQMSRPKRLLAIVAAFAMWTVIQSGTVSAQTSGVGGDGYTRNFWIGTDGRISVWKLDPNLNFVTPAQQKEATRRRAQGATLDELARSYAVAISTIRRVTRAA